MARFLLRSPTELMEQRAQQQQNTRQKPPEAESCLKILKDKHTIPGSPCDHSLGEGIQGRLHLIKTQPSLDGFCL